MFLNVNYWGLQFQRTNHKNGYMVNVKISINVKVHRKNIKVRKNDFTFNIKLQKVGQSCKRLFSLCNCAKYYSAKERQDDDNRINIYKNYKKSVERTRLKKEISRKRKVILNLIKAIFRLNFSSTEKNSSIHISAKAEFVYKQLQKTWVLDRTANVSNENEILKDMGISDYNTENITNRMSLRSQK